MLLFCYFYWKRTWNNRVHHMLNINMATTVWVSFLEIKQ